MEIKDLQAQLQTTFEELKKMGERQETELKTFGQASQETKTSIERINTAFDEIKGRIEAIETKANRLPSGAGENNDPKAAEKKNAFFKFMRNGLGDLSREEKALVQDTTGDILVPSDLDSVIYRSLPQLNVLRSLAAVRNTNSDRIRRIGMNEVTTDGVKLKSRLILNYQHLSLA